LLSAVTVEGRGAWHVVVSFAGLADVVGLEDVPWARWTMWARWDAPPSTSSPLGLPTRGITITAIEQYEIPLVFGIDVRRILVQSAGLPEI